MEDKLEEIAKEMEQLANNKAETDEKNINMEIILAIIGDFLENLEFLLLASPNQLKRAAYFGILFAETLTYDELLSENVRLAPYLELIDYPTDATPNSLILTYQKLTKLILRLLSSHR